MSEEPLAPSLSGPIPERLGRYRVVDRLAIGGMAEVFVCYERGLGGLERLAVVKRILPQLAAQESFLQMFLAEARYVALINHPNVVQVLELAQDENGAPFLAMEYIPGNSVRELIVVALGRHMKTPIGAVVGIIAQACAGVHAAHDLVDTAGRPLGLVHRDISPHNLMVTGDGHVKLLDFGIAKATEGLLDEQTRTGGLKGKVHYMSPEQCKQHPLDRRSDIFALAVVLWEALAAERLFKRESELEAMHAIINGERRELSQFRSDVPDEIHAVLVKALSPDKEDRHATADEMRKALVDACAKHGIACGADEVAAFVRPLLGEAQKVRQADLLRRARYPSVGRPDPLQNEGATVAPLDSSADTRVLVPEGARRRFRALPLLAALGLVGLVVGIAVGAADRLLPPAGAPLTIVFPPTADADLMLEDIEPLRSWLEKTLERPATISIAESYSDLEARVLTGKLDLAAMPPYLYVETKDRDPRVEIVASKLVQGSSGNDSILYVGESSTITQIAELKGKRLCFPDRKSTTGYLFPRLALRRAGLDPDHDVVGHFSGSHMQALRDLVAGVCDATATYSGGFLGADRAGIPVARIKQLAIIARSPHQALVVPANVPEAERRRIQRALLSYHPADGGESGRVERISGFKDPDPNDYDTVRAALEEAAE